MKRLLGFLFVKTWIKFLERSEIERSFTRQENTVIQACVVATAGIAFSDYDHRLQTDISKWYCDRSPYQQLSHTSGCKAGKGASESIRQILILQPLVGGFSMVLCCWK
ncbi:uncharacterized protein LOC141671030 isoform X5 [Apium graveolens]|uniref:uncharacterized protein LOC141671030 isoform X5 n=1 Tax=Apium graveolens TaxID=4045 RepID=UPI003D7ABC19